MLIFALLIAAPQGEPIGVVAPFELLPSLSRVLQQTTNLAPIEIDGADMLGRCGKQLRCIAEARPAEARLLLIVDRTPQGKLTAQLIDGAAAEHFRPPDDESSLVFARAEVDGGGAEVERLIVEALSPALDELDLMREQPLAIEIVEAPPAPVKQPHKTMRHALAWSASAIGTIGLGLVLSRATDGECFVGGDGCTPFGLAPTETLNPALVGYSFITLGLVTSLTAWLARRDSPPWWQAIAGAASGLVVFSILLILDQTGVFQSEEVVFLGPTFRPL